LAENATVKAMRTFILSGVLLFAAFPATSNYHLNSYGFGSGGTANSSTTTYALEGSTGEISGSSSSTSNAQTKPGFIQTQQANVPQLASIDNNSGQYYNKLHFVIDNQNNPSDATFLIAVSTDNFVSDTRYLQPDGTLSSTLNLSDYQTYAAWGGTSGSLMVGLVPSTTYSVKLRATQGKFTESAYGPTSTQATAAPTITFSLATSSSSTPPYTIGFGTLSAGTVATAPQTINTTLSTNGASGGDVYISGQNGGLKSGSTGYLINAITNDLGTVSEGFGVQNSSVGQTSGGPFSVLSPYAGSGNTVGLVDSTTRSLYSSSTPITAGSGVLSLKAKAAATDVAARDYQEILTFVASANF
jgi:hypothetical protein